MTLLGTSRKFYRLVQPVRSLVLWASEDFQHVVTPVTVYNLQVVHLMNCGYFARLFYNSRGIFAI